MFSGNIPILIYWHKFEDMENYEIINQIPIKSILDFLRIQYRSEGPTMYLFCDGKQTDWWIWNIQLNYINDFSSRWRAKGPPFAFVRTYLHLDDRQTFERFEDKFGIWWGVIKKTKSIYKKRRIRKYPVYNNNR